MKHYRDQYPALPNGEGLENMKMQNDSQAIDFEAAVAHLNESEEYLIERARARRERIAAPPSGSK